jgi:glycosyltransferase involved in cell wall biosynthesis
MEIRQLFKGKVGFFSGTEFNVVPEVGLNGFCDFLLTASTEIYEICCPVITLVEAKNENIKVVKGGLPAIARNNGFKEVKTPYVLFLDADMDVSKLPLKQIVAAMINRNIKLATCNITTWNLKYALFYKLFDLVQWIISFKTPFAVGGFMLFNSEYFKELGQFDEEDKFAEDYHLSMKAKPKYFKIFNYYASTSDRRFKNKGFWYMCKLMIRCWLNRNNDDFYKQDYNYWS